MVVSGRDSGCRGERGATDNVLWRLSRLLLLRLLDLLDVLKFATAQIAAVGRAYGRCYFI